jgi:diguanylate cyclase (GGDEF)-like protein/PAS domain S-box-containing protein
LTLNHSFPPSWPDTPLPLQRPRQLAEDFSLKEVENLLLARKRTNRRFIATAVVALLLTAGFGLWVTLQFGGITLSQRIDDLGVAAAAFIAAVVGGIAAWRHAGRIRLAWLLISVSAFAWSMGEAVRSYYEIGLGKHVPFPSLADAGFLGAVPFAAVGVLLFTAARRRTLQRLATILDGLIVGGSLLAVSWITILETIYNHSADSAFAQAISLAYPISDVVILSMLLLLLSGRVHARDRLRLALLAGGLLANLLADSGVAYLTAVNAYGPAPPIAIAWVTGYLLIALAGVRACLIPINAQESKEQSQSLWQLFLPYIPLTAAVLASCADAIITGSVDDFVFFDLVVVVVLVVIRQFMMLAVNINLTQRLREQTAGLQRREEHLRSLIEHSSDAATLADGYGVIRFQSASVQRMFAFASGELVGTRLVDLAHVADRPALLNCLSDALKASAHPTSVTCRLRHKLGTWTHCEVTITNLLYLPSVEGLVINIRDVSDRKQLEEKVSHQAGHDPLTNLANRSSFRNALEQALRELEPNRSLAVLIVDVDDFKSVNERLGSELGDQLLTAVGGRLEQMVPAEALAARLRSDEFAILLPNTTLSQAGVLAASIMDRFTAPFRAGETEVVMRVSVGGAGLIAGQETGSDLLRNADLALRVAKAKGRARYQRYEPGMRIQGVVGDAA